MHMNNFFFNQIEVKICYHSNYRQKTVFKHLHQTNSANMPRELTPWRAVAQS